MPATVMFSAGDDVDQRLAVFEDGRDELVHQVAVRAAVAAGRHARRQRRTLQVGQVLLQPAVGHARHHARAARARGPLSPPWPRRVPTDGHPRHAAFAGAQQGDLRAEGVLVAVVLRLQVLDDRWACPGTRLR